MREESGIACTGMTVVCTVPGLLAARAESDPDRVAMRLLDGASLTFSEWERRSNAVAAKLLGRDIDRGARIGLIFGSSNWPEYAIAYCGVQKAGAVAVPISEKAPQAEIDYMLGACQATCSIGMGSGTERSGVGFVPFEDLDGDEAIAPGVELRGGDLAQILYTSGTAGRPKGVAATHANLAFGYQLAPKRRTFEHSEYFVHAFPIGGTAAQVMLLKALVVHPSALVIAGFDAEVYCATIEKYGVGTAFVVPAMAIELLNSKAYERHDLSSVVVLSSSGSALPPSVARSLADVFTGATVFNVYTSTEAMPAWVTMMLDPEAPDSVGLPLGSADIEIRGEDGTALPEGEVGEVWLRCPMAPRTYYGDDEATAATFQDGWVRMGDVGRMDEDGHLYLLDRESDVVQCGAMRVSTTEVEAALYEHPHVREAAVLGLPHPVMGSMIAAAVVLAEDGSLHDVRAFLRERLASYKVPVRWKTAGALPRNQMGKVVKQELRPLLES